MLTPRTAGVLWIVAAFSAVFLALKLWPVAMAAAIGTAAGVIIGANLPERWRRRLVVRLPSLN